ncbi:MAG: flavodoxin domain-containing protein [Defluviitaleaceae bacterium]|nr:flavodoxin domain-containing protein [Defluviitaleaceae bacterium]
MSDMTKNVAVIYKTQYGTTKKYAEWIAEALDADIFETAKISPAQLMFYDVVVYGGGLYAGGIAGVKLVTKNPCKNLVVFSVGLADPVTTDFSDILKENFTQEQLSSIKVFHLRGGMEYGKLGLIHKGIMSVVRRQAAKKDEAELTSDDKMFLETYGNHVDFVDQNTINPIVDYVKKKVCTQKGVQGVNPKG